MSILDVFITNYTLVDPEVYQLWVQGHNASEAVKVIAASSDIKKIGATIDLIESDVNDHYRTYSMLEKCLYFPSQLAEMVIFQIEPAIQQYLIEKYYEFDNTVIREFLGKKLTAKHRKDLDEVSEKTNVLLKSCRRQFDNVKRVFKTVEELSGDLYQNIKLNFLLSDELSRKYAAIVFIAYIRFETSKRKLLYLNFTDFYHCATAMMAHWTYRDATPEYDLDREFLLDLRDVRVLLEKEREHKHLVCQRLKPTLLEKSYQELENNFRSYSRAIIGLACNLHKSRELKCFFVELVERCIEPWKQVTWSAADLKNFLVAYEQCAAEIDVFREVDLKIAWERYMAVVSICLQKMYHN